MDTLRSIRRSRALTFFDLAQLTGIPVRLLAEAEYGLRQLSAYERTQLAFVLGMSEAHIVGPAAARSAEQVLPAPLARQLATAALATALLASAVRPARDVASMVSAGAAAIWPAPLAQQIPPPAAAPLAVAKVRQAPTQATTATSNPTATSSPTVSPTASRTPTATMSPTPTQSPFHMTAQGPQGCPLLPSAGHIIMTQGYGEGTHAPAEVMGAIDLAIEGGETFGTKVVATHAGVVRAQADTWPAGNHIWVIDAATGWRSGYAHLSAFLVEDGQHVAAGTPIGLVGSTGMSTGPHLHYHVWHGEMNVDPTDLAAVCFRSDQGSGSALTP